jgi:hypothetical protein
MDEKFLQQFLKTGLLDIGDSDDRLKWLQESITELKKNFDGDYGLLPKFTLVALDPNIPDTEPVMIQTEEIITHHWKALRGKYTDMPINIIRAVILNALNSVGEADPYAARIIYLTAINFYPFAKLNAEKKLINEMLKQLGELAEKNAVEEWSLMDAEPSLKIGTLKLNGLKIEGVKFDAPNFKAKWDEAFTNSPSGHGPQHGIQNNEYKVHFQAKTTEAISSSISATLENLSKSISAVDIETPLNKFFSDFKKNLDATLKASFSSLTAVERRSKLLWWKETLYSPSKKRSYREVAKNILPILMSFDLNIQVPQITPISVDYLLRDTLFLLIDKQDTPIQFSEYLSQINNENLKAVIKSCFYDLTETEGRICVTEFIALLVNGRVELKDFKSRTGIDESELITLADLAVVILHDFLTQRLITE